MVVYILKDSDCINTWFLQCENFAVENCRGLPKVRTRFGNSWGYCNRRPSTGESFLLIVHCNHKGKEKEAKSTSLQNVNFIVF